MFKIALPIIPFFLFLSVASLTCKNQRGEFDYRSIYLKKYGIALAHYSKPKDSLKLRALQFILRNLNDQYFNQSDWLDAYNIQIYKRANPPLSFLVGKLDSVKHSYNNRLNKITDQSTISNKYLIKNVDEAFTSIKHPWVKSLSFQDFCEYILPYKIGNESPEDWRTLALQEGYLSLDSLLQISDEFSAAAYINNHLNWFKGTLNYDYPVDGGYNLTRWIATGSCYTASRLALFQMRAIGLPVVVDYVPCWGNRSDGHYWNALIYHGKPYPFDPTGPNIGYYKIQFKGIDRIPYKIAKVFRKTFSIQDSSLTQMKTAEMTCPDIFDDKRIKDVTNQYIPVSDITLNFKGKIKKPFAYLYTFNNKTWTPCSWGKTIEKTVVFKNMGRDIVYLPALYLNVNEIITLGNPFILKKDGTTKELKVDRRDRQTLIITRKYPEDETNKIKKGDIYELFYWDGIWRSLGKQFSKDNKLFFNNAPTNALFWIRDLTEGKEERIFTYENNSQVWW